MFNEFHHQLRGRAHTDAGIPSQDRTFHLNENGVQVVCVADGAGSAPHSGLGAEVVVREGAKLFSEQFYEFESSTTPTIVREMIGTKLLEALNGAAGERGLEIRDLASTFLCVAVADDKFIGAHVGDGVVGYMKAGILQVASKPDNAEFANETTFVTSSGAAATMRMFRGTLEDVDGFILMTDGPSSILYNQAQSILAPACTKLIRIVGRGDRRGADYKKRLRKFMAARLRKLTTDDCGLAILGR